MLLARAPQRAREAEARRTDQDDAYTGVIPAERQKAITKPARQTKHIERFKNALRQRVSRLVRETLSFSKKLAHHIGALTYRICHTISRGLQRQHSLCNTTAKEAYTGAGRLEQHEVVLTAAARVTPYRAHGIAVGRGTWAATQQVAEVTAARSDCIAGFGLLTASRVRDIRPASSWRPASVGNGHGAKLPKNPAR